MGAGSTHLPNLGSVKLSFTIILKVVCTSEGPFVGYQTFTESVSAQGRGKYSTFSGKEIHPLEDLSENDSGIQRQSINEDTPVFTADVEEQENTEQRQEEKNHC